MPEDLTRRRFVGLLGAASAAVAGCASAPALDTDAPDDGSGANDNEVRTASRTVGQRETASDAVDESRFVRVYDRTRDSVVQIRVIGSDGNSQGTGWVFDDRGRIVTNEHVVRDAEEVFVRFPSTGWRQVTVLGEDVYSDLGVVEVSNLPEPAEPLPLVTSDPPVGTEVLAIGNPFGLSGTVSSGIVSGVNRTLPAPRSNFSIPDAIQTDAPVNPGNSGGPLVDLDSRVIGVVNSGGGDNIGFAISGAMVDRVAPELIEVGNYEHSYVGIGLRPVTPALAAANGLDEGSGVYVHRVLEDSPSVSVFEGSTGTETAYDQEVPVGGDVIKTMGGAPIPTRQALASFLALQTRPGDTIDVGIVRDGTRQTVQLTLGSRPPPGA